MPRTIETHKVNGCNDALKLEVLDDPGIGGASSLYHITGFNSQSNPSDPWTKRHGEPAQHSTVLFQNGAIGVAGTNGITHEVLIAILIDRLTGFQTGPFASSLNAKALYHLERAAAALKERTLQRVARGVEGTHTV